MGGKHRAGESEAVLTLHNVSKRFCRNLRRALRYGFQDVCRELTGTRGDSVALRNQEFWALKDVSLDLKRGECLGLVGANGAGKTTLLRLVSGLIKPDAGRVVLHGRVAPLLALGAGFNPILTGRENIFVNMAVLGASNSEIRKAYDAVVAFAEIEDAIDAPVLSYSSGMTARLGFACAIHVAPEILLVDEVLSVGDMRFRAKCYRKLAELRKAGTSVLLVSHNSNDLLGVCDRLAFLKHGCLVQVGSGPNVLRAYEADLFAGDQADTAGPQSRAGDPKIERVYLTGEHGLPVQALQTASKGSIRIDVTAVQLFKNVSMLLIIRSLNGEIQSTLNMSSERDNRLFEIPPGRSTLECDLPVVCLRPGLYAAKIVLHHEGLAIINAVESYRFYVTSEKPLNSTTFYQPRSWNMMPAQTSDAGHNAAPTIKKELSGVGL